MNELANVFNYGGYQVRTVVQDGEPWFVATDICDVLDVGNSRQALTRLDDDEKNTVILTDGIKTAGNPNVAIINESGLYSLVMGSRKAEAKAFKKWVTSEVLPAIRKTGRYVAEESDPKIYLANAVLIANKMIAEQDQTIAEQTQYIAMLEPKIEVLNAILVSDDDIPIEAMAKLLGYKPQGFYKWVRHAKFIRKDKMPAQFMLDNGFMTFKETPWENGFYKGFSIVPYFTQAAIPRLRVQAEKFINSVPAEVCMLKRSAKKKREDAM